MFRNMEIDADSDEERQRRVAPAKYIEGCVAKLAKLSADYVAQGGDSGVVAGGGGGDAGCGGGDGDCGDDAGAGGEGGCGYESDDDLKRCVQNAKEALKSKDRFVAAEGAIVLRDAASSAAGRKYLGGMLPFAQMLQDAASKGASKMAAQQASGEGRGLSINDKP